jgi:iron complex transport system permease protein
MADPYIIGVSAGAALGATAAIVLHVTFAIVGISAITLSAFVAALLVTMLVYRLAWFRGDVMVEHLLLAGVAVGAFLAAIISALQLLGGESLQQVIFWLMGGFSGRTWDHVLLTVPYVVVGYAVAQVLARDLNLLMLGDETARSLGVSAGRVRSILIAAGALVAAAAVSVSGLIGFVGLVVPHLIRLVVGPDHRRLLPAAALGGAITLLLADTLARSIAPPMEIPVGIVTAALGAPFFLYLLRRHRRRTYWS